MLDRFARCIESMPAVPDVVVRMCADRPLACPVLLRELVDIYEAVGRPDYLANNLVRSFPDGLDVELVKTTQLLAAAEAAADSYEREHVTPVLLPPPGRVPSRERSVRIRQLLVRAGRLDTEHDYRRLVEVERRLAKAAPDYEYRDAGG